MSKGKKRGNGEGGITKRPNGRYLARKAKMVGDELVRSSKTFDTRKEANEWLKGTEHSVAVSTLSEWLDAWLELIKPDVANKTYAHDKWRVEKHLKPRLGPVRLRDLTAEQIAGTLAKMATDGQSDSERQKAGAVLRKALRTAVKFKRIPVNPMADIKLPTPDRQESRAMTPEQLAAVIQAAEDLFRLGYAFRLWADSGMRPAEMYAFEWAAFDAEKRTAKVVEALDGVTNERKKPKTRQSKRGIKLAPSTVAALVAARPVEGSLVMPASNGGPYWASNFLKCVLEPIRERSGVNWLVPYTFRHTMATLLLRAGVPLKMVSERLGHADVMTTLRHYAHVLEGDQDRAAAVMESYLNPMPTKRLTTPEATP